MKRDYSEITPEITGLASLSTRNGKIAQELFTKHSVFRGLRDMEGNGVLTGLTEISEIKAKETINGEVIPCRGKLYYRGVDVNEIVSGFLSDSRYGFEETVYLLLFGELPDKGSLDNFNTLLAGYRSLPNSFIRDIIMKAPSTDMMNSLARSVLTLYSYDNNPDSIEIPNVLRQCLQLIALLPMLSVYSYQAYSYYLRGGMSFFIHDPLPGLSTAENLLYMLRPDGKYTPTEAKVLDIALVLHAEHGGGNNSTFANRVISSSGTDTYSAIAGALGSLKDPKHGGANRKVVAMFEDIKEHITDWNDEDEIREYLKSILAKNAFDRTGLIYGMGHAVYSLSDPRAEIFKRFVGVLASEKGRDNEYGLYERIERIAPQIIAQSRQIFKGVSANIDFYSGFVYRMIDIPPEMYTPLFAVSRIAGWSAHRIEELINAGKIIRPAYMSVQPHVKYVPLGERSDSSCEGSVDS
ncbi:MAG TPA: citrate/2-methylcitrate synthase [Bacillota bacterium]|nr:citrate/2-methylcitrate synthase [Bacillota bacterium]